MVEFPATWARIARVWWAFFWRMTLLSFAALLIFYSVSVVVLLSLGVTIAEAEAFDRSRWVQLVFFLLGAIASLLATRLVLGTRWAEFRIALLPSSPSDGDSATTPST
jgi:hypothetical protein